MGALQLFLCATLKRPDSIEISRICSAGADILGVYVYFFVF